MDYMEALTHLKENYPDEFSTDGFSDGSTELLLNELYYGLKDHVKSDVDLSEVLYKLIAKISPKIEFFTMCYAAEAYKIGIDEQEDE